MTGTITLLSNIIGAFLMNTRKEILIKQIKDQLMIFYNCIGIDNSANLTDLNIAAEDVACDLLNMIFGWNLKNLNLKRTNNKGIDLADTDNGICVQVTSETGREKIEKTLDRIKKAGYEKEYKKLIMFYLANYTPKFRKDFECSDDFFNPTTNCYALQELIAAIAALDTDKIERINEYLKRELVLVVVADERYEQDEFTNQENVVRGLCTAKLRTLGLDEQTTKKIILETIKQNTLVVNDEADKLLFLVGGFGSGKSHQLYCLFLKMIREYKDNSVDKYYPVFVEAKNISKQEEIKRFIERARKHSGRLLIIIDGLDEVSLDSASNIVEAIELMIYSSEHIKAIISTRPLTIIHGKKQITPMRLTEQNINDLYYLINNREIRIQNTNSSNKRALLETLSKPFCAVVYCIYSKDKYFVNEMDFITVFIEKTVSKTVAKYPECEDIIKILAAKAIDYNLGNIDKSEMGEIEKINIVLKTGLFTETGRAVSFVLPIIAQWYAALAIRNRLVSLDDLLQDEDRLVKWIYPLALLFNQITFEESIDFFGRIVVKTPGIASLIVRAGEGLFAEVVNENKKMNGEFLYKSFSIWLKMLGIKDSNLFKDGRLNTILFDQDGAQITYGIGRRYTGKNVEVTKFNMRDNNYYGMCNIIKGCSIATQPTWPWIESLNYIGDIIIAEKIKNREFVVKDSILEQEYIWATCLKLLNISKWGQTSIDIKKIVSYLEKIPRHGVMAVTIGRSQIDLNRISDLVYNLYNNGVEVIECPYIQGSLQIGGFIWSHYTDDEMKRFVEKVFCDALNAYESLVETCFGSLKEQMGFYRLLPAKFEGFFDFDRGRFGPSITWGLQPIEKGIRSKVSLENRKCRDFNGFFKDMFDRIKSNSFVDIEKPYISYRVHSQACLFIGSDTPVTDVVYNWLEDDLRSIGVIKR